jgi:3-methyladenine DNA glycosylase AlkD
LLSLFSLQPSEAFVKTTNMRLADYDARMNHRTRALELERRIASLPLANTPSVRRVRREFSRILSPETPRVVLDFARLLLSRQDPILRFVAYELVSQHKPTFATISSEQVVELGGGLDSWSSVDCFALYLSGPIWAAGRISDQTIVGWASLRSTEEDRWWRRAALVSTVPLSRQGLTENIPKTLRVCELLMPDRDDMIVKALSWALRELARKHKNVARSFLVENRRNLSPRVLREVECKLTSGLKSPRKTRSQQG